MRLPNPWFLMLFLCVFMSIMMSLGFNNSYKSRQVAQKGQMVDVKVLRVNEGRFGKKRSYALVFIYQGEEKSILVSRTYYNDVKDLSSTSLLHSPEYPDLFLEPEYNNEGQLLSVAGLIGLFIITGIYSIFKIKDGGILV